MKAFLAIALALSSVFVSHTASSQPPTFRDGTYLVNQQITPGIYRSTGKGTSCYWERTAESGDILDNDFSLPGGAVTIQPTDFKFRSRGCGAWSAIDPNNKPALPIEKQAAPRKDGHYLVGIDIAPGLWRSNGAGARCYWSRLTATQDLIDNDLGYGGGAVLIRPEDFEFYTSGCGTWSMLDTNNLPTLPADKQATPKKDGVYIIGLNMAPGRWRSNGAGAKCYWEKTTSTQEIIDNNFGAGSVIVEIAPTDFQFEASNCGTWTLTSGNGVGTPLDPAQAPAAAKGPACPNPNICILTPVSGSRVVRGNILTFSGTAAGPNFVRYQFLAGINGSWGHIADFQKPVTNGDLMELHTDTLPPGTYRFRLQVIDNTGNASADRADVVVTLE